MKGTSNSLESPLAFAHKALSSHAESSGVQAGNNLLTTFTTLYLELSWARRRYPLHGGH